METKVVPIGDETSLSRTDPFSVEGDSMEEVSSPPPNTIVAVVSVALEGNKVIVVPMRKCKASSREAHETLGSNLEKKKRKYMFSQITDPKYF